MPDEQPIGYRRLVHVVGPNYRDNIEITADKLEELEPEFVEVEGVKFERYRNGETEDDWVEVRFDLVVARSTCPVYPAPEDTDPPIDKIELGSGGET